jgi:hypothetical protein
MQEDLKKGLPRNFVRRTHVSSEVAGGSISIHHMLCHSRSNEERSDRLLKKNSGGFAACSAVESHAVVAVAEDAVRDETVHTLALHRFASRCVYPKAGSAFDSAGEEPRDGTAPKMRKVEDTVMY